ncbi:hypothetical protein KSS87_016458 [Heliosperma pusillum]|nr:hypothetical protein KSS87_016458 [Heliosperma pusillum]
MEEAKNQEILKLKDTVHAMQVKIDESNSLLEQESKSVNKAVEEAPSVVQEIQVMVEDTEKIESLEAEVKSFKTSEHRIALLALIASLKLHIDRTIFRAGQKASLEAEKQRAEEYYKKLAESQELSEERHKKLEDTDRRNLHLQESLQRLEEKLTNLESENQVLRQQAVSMAPKKFLSSRSRSILQRGSESGRFADEHLRDLHSHSSNHRESEIEEKPQKFLNEKQQENQELLIRCIAQPLGFAGNRPIAACIIYKCMLHWRSFEVERTTIFDRIIQIIGHAIEENNDNLAYWLSNASTLLYLLQHTLKASSAAGIAPQRRRSYLSVTVHGRVSQSIPGTPHGSSHSFVKDSMVSGIGSLHQVEAKYPALLFKQQLTAYGEKIYGIVRDNLKKEISPLVELCIQAPRTSRASLVKGSSRSVANTAAQQALIAHWQGIVKVLVNFLNIFKENHVPSLSSLLLRRECCSFSNGEYVKTGLAELQQWCYTATEECNNLGRIQYAGASWEALKHIRQAIGFLVIHQKRKISLDEIIHHLCPVLSIQQLYRIGTMYWDDKYGTHSLNPDVIANMRALMTEDSKNAVSNSFLLDDDSSILFSVDDISRSMDKIDIAGLEPPPLIRNNSGFNFL